MADTQAPYDYEAAVVAMLTLRINTREGEWLNESDHKLFWGYYDEAVTADGEEDAVEGMLLTMMNMAWYALINLAVNSDEPPSTWLQRIAIDVRDVPGPSGDSNQGGE